MSEIKIDLNDLDKSNWKTYRFDEIAKNISERVDPNNTDLKVYIGLEHIDSESLHIKRHGTPDDVNGTKLKFYKGDIIFGRRRAYQRKAGIATWDGFCSAHALVLRANPDVIDPELFPFFMHSDLFMNRAIDISVGSLSPTINWGTLKHQEFKVPPKELQGRVTELFLNLDKSISKEDTLLKKIVELYTASREEKISKGNYDARPLSELVTQSITYGIVQPGDHVDGGMPFIQSSDIKESKIAKTLQCTSQKIAEKYFRSEVNPGDVLFSLRGNIGATAIVPDYLVVANMARGVARLSLKPEFDNFYIKYALETLPVMTRMLAVSQGSTFKEISLETLRKVKLPIPKSLNEQKNISNNLMHILDAKHNAESKHHKFKQLKSTLIRQVF